LKDITRLLASWPSATGEGEEQLRSYLLAVDDYPADDVTAGIDALIKGIAPGVNPNFLPPPAVVGGECRRQMGMRLDSERRDNMCKPRLMPPDIQHTPDERARMQAKVDQFLADVAVKTEDPALVKRRNEQWTKTNARFMPDMSPEALSRRLGRKAGFTVGDDHEDAA
jgi:hypothetical protein